MNFGGTRILDSIAPLPFACCLTLKQKNEAFQSLVSHLQNRDDNNIRPIDLCEEQTDAESRIPSLDFGK